MFTLQTMVEASPRAMHFRHALAAAFAGRRKNMPAPPGSVSVLLEASRHGIAGMLSKPGVRAALGETRARLFNIPGRDADAQSAWHESLATGAFAARIAQLRKSDPATAFCGGLLHRAGEALALKILARVELEYRMKLATTAARDWASERGGELLERLVRAWDLPTQVGICALGLRQLAGFERGAAESAVLDFGRTCAWELLQPSRCAPGAVEAAAADCGLNDTALQCVREESSRVRALIKALD